jgi:ABC-type glycerol-3-phosphate transport system substrate-binding protein
MHPIGLFANQQVLEKAGLDPKRLPTTREDYGAALDELKVKGIQGGRGHNSVVAGPDGEDRIASRAWDEAGERRQMWIERL